MGYKINYSLGERVGCSSQIEIADRIFYVKLFNLAPPKYFSGDQQGVIQKEISKTEFELWISILADSENDVKDILEQMSTGKKY